MPTFKQILRDAVRRLLSRPAEGDTVSVAKREAARFVERRQMRFGERRGFAERQARAAELQVLLAVELADREAGRHAARRWANFLGVAVVVSCVAFLSSSSIRRYLVRFTSRRLIWAAPAQRMTVLAPEGTLR